MVIEDEESDWEDRVNGGKTEDRDGIMISRKPMLLINPNRSGLLDVA